MSESAVKYNVPFEVNETYEPYSNDPDYIAGNRGFIGALALGQARRVLDLACGIGTLADLLWERRSELDIVGIDLSPEALMITRQRFEQAGRFEDRGSKGGCLGLAAATADILPLADGCVDAVVMGHSIHLIDDEEALLSEVYRILRPGGLFAFSTSFYAGTFVEGTERLYHDWVKEALTYIQKKDRALRSAGKPGIRRTRGSVAPAFSKTWPSAEDWTDRLSKHGFTDHRVSVRTVDLTQYSFETIAAYGGFASVILSGYPVDISSEALQASAGPTLKAAGVERVPRYWLEVSATRA